MNNWDSNPPTTQEAEVKFRIVLYYIKQFLNLQNRTQKK